MVVMFCIPRAATSEEGCESCTIGLDLSYRQGTLPWEGTAVAIFGGSVGQTFPAVDTLIKSISVWQRQGPCSCTSPIKLWVTRTDSSGSFEDGFYAFRPGDIIQEGPVARVFGDSATQAPKRIRYSFDPPLRLPGPGNYALFVQDLCSTGIEVYTNSSNAYPHGRMARTSRSEFYGCNLAASYVIVYDFERDRFDMLFEVEFCRTTSTPVQRETWGKLKARYR
jgi:hypothetical protein